MRRSVCCKQRAVHTEGERKNKRRANTEEYTQMRDSEGGREMESSGVKKKKWRRGEIKTDNEKEGAQSKFKERMGTFRRQRNGWREDGGEERQEKKGRYREDHPEKTD